MGKLVVLIDDDLNMIRLLRAVLEKNGYQVIPFLSGESALASLPDLKPAAVILDVVMPGMDGIDVLKQIRSQRRLAKLPVIMLTSRDSEVATVLGLELGADDYLSKPVRYHELLTRLKKWIVRTDALPASPSDLVRIHGITINRTACEVQFQEQPVTLTHLEFELLALLAASPGKVFTRDQLLDLLWHEEQNYETRTVDVHIRRLRKKLEDCGLNPQIIETVRSVGYRMGQAKD